MFFKIFCPIRSSKDFNFGSDRFHPTKVVVNEPFSFCIPTIIKCAPVYKKDIQLGLFKYVKSSVLEKNWSSETWTWSGSQSINGNKLYKLNQ